MTDPYLIGLGLLFVCESVFVEVEEDEEDVDDLDFYVLLLDEEEA